MSQLSSIIFIGSFILGIVAQLTKINLYEMFLVTDSNNSIVSFSSNVLTEFTRYLIQRLEQIQRPKYQHQKQKETLRILQLGVGHQSLCQHILSNVVERFNHQFNVVVDIIEQDQLRYRSILEDLKCKCIEEYYYKQKTLFSFYNKNEYNNKSKQDESFQINLFFPNDYNIVYLNPNFHSYDIVISTIDEKLVEPEALSNMLDWLQYITHDRFSVITRINYPYNISWLTQVLNPSKLEKIKNTLSIQHSFIHNKHTNITDIILNVPPVQIIHSFQNEK